MEKVQNRIGSWKNKFLSFVGRLQLVQSVISSMHVYWSSPFILPAHILMDIEQSMRGFFWCQRTMRHGRAKVAWEDVCLPKCEGGLGIRSLELLNVALISTNVWSILTLKESLWVKWIHTHKLRGRNFWDFPFRGSMTWGWCKLLQIRPIIHKFVWHKLGDGASTSAWFDHWCNYSPLMDSLTARAISTAGLSLETKVADLVLNDCWTWPIEWETRYPNIYHSIVPRLNFNKDQLVWKDRLGRQG